MVGVTDLKAGTSFKMDGQMYVVLKYEHIKMGRGTGTVKLKVRNLENGAVVEKGFITGARVEPVDVRQREANYLYKAGDQLMFMDARTYDQFEVTEKILGDQAKFLQEGAVVKVMFAGGEDAKPVMVDLPPKMTFVVTEADPGVKGDSAANMLKTVTLSNGLKVRVPLFIKEGDKVVVDTRTSEYIERAK